MIIDPNQIHNPPLTLLGAQSYLRAPSIRRNYAQISIPKYFHVFGFSGWAGVYNSAGKRGHTIAISRRRQF
jgi:hypothetical protein